MITTKKPYESVDGNKFSSVLDIFTSDWKTTEETRTAWHSVCNNRREYVVPKDKDVL